MKRLLPVFMFLILLTGSAFGEHWGGYTQGRGLSREEAYFVRNPSMARQYQYKNEAARRVVSDPNGNRRSSRSYNSGTRRYPR